MHAPLLQIASTDVYFDQFYDQKPEPVMRTVSLAEAKAHFSELVTQVAAGEEVVITRHGQPIVRLCSVEKTKMELASREQFRAGLPRLAQTSATLIRSLRDEER